MRRALFAFTAATLAACHSPEGAVTVESMAAVRLPDGRVQVDVQLYAIEQSGGNAGAYCVSVHYLPLGVDPGFTPGFHAYTGELEAAQQCAADLEDGDTRTYRFVSTRTDLTVNYDVRGQVIDARRFDWKDAPIP